MIPLRGKLAKDYEFSETWRIYGEKSVLKNCIRHIMCVYVHVIVKMGIMGVRLELGEKMGER